ncbi:hypothetical protein KIW84_034970 [Lathyrus oleraceus]|uniref:Uncharacterized protein n=1 Tax=Pisum sativum TaxID=3888 RepID=A0A9D4Y2E5_PEA|nr:hypothetical protein KIW84_034970 [Pisum sativum]
MADVNENEDTSEDDILGRDDSNFQLVVSRSHKKKKDKSRKLRRIISPKLRAPNIKEVLRSPPNPRWKTCNRDRALNVSSNTAGAGGILRNHLGDFVFSFAETIEPNLSFLLKLQPLSSVWIMRFRRVGINIRLKQITPWPSKPIPTLFWFLGSLETIGTTS